MIVLITLVVVSAFTLSSSNLKSVGNMQVREEAVAAANNAVDQALSAPFTNALGTQTFAVDINHDGTADYSVQVGTPTCLRAATASDPAPSDVELPVALQSASTWNTDWDFDATVKDAASGATVRIRQGIRLLLSQIQKDSVCN